MSRETLILLTLGSSGAFCLGWYIGGRSFFPVYLFQRLRDLGRRVCYRLKCPPIDANVLSLRFKMFGQILARLFGEGRCIAYRSTLFYRILSRYMMGYGEDGEYEAEVLIREHCLAKPEGLNALTMGIPLSERESVADTDQSAADDAKKLAAWWVYAGTKATIMKKISAATKDRSYDRLLIAKAIEQAVNDPIFDVYMSHGTSSDIDLCHADVMKTLETAVRDGQSFFRELMVKMKETLFPEQDFSVLMNWQREILRSVGNFRS